MFFLHLFFGLNAFVYKSNSISSYLLELRGNFFTIWYDIVNLLTCTEVRLFSWGRGWDERGTSYTTEKHSKQDSEILQKALSICRNLPTDIIYLYKMHSRSRSTIFRQFLIWAKLSDCSSPCLPFRNPAFNICHLTWQILTTQAATAAVSLYLWMH